MDCKHPEEAFDDPGTDDINTKENEDGYFYIEKCGDCGTKCEIHLSHDDVEFQTIEAKLVSVEVIGNKEIRPL